MPERSAERSVVRVGPRDVRPLRAAVLRPGTPPADTAYPGDEAPETVHLAAVVGGEIVGIATLLRERLPGDDRDDRDDRDDAWRLRGMATAPEARGHGHGGALLRACLDHVAEGGGGLLWCNARLVAVGFYLRHGLVIRGEQFEIAGIGQHYRMLAAVDPSTSESEQRKAH